MQCFPPVGEQAGKRQQVEAMFDAIAPRYDLLNRLLSFGVDRRWRQAAVRALQVRPGAHILDVATGTGDLALAALAAAPDRITGVDVSERMLAVARAKAGARGAGKTMHFVRGLAEALPLEDQSFDAAMVGFGVRNFQNLDHGLRELCRVLRPGARLAVLEFSQPPARLVRVAYDLYSRSVMPFVGRLISRVEGAYHYLPASIRAFPCGEAFLARMRAAGFDNLHCALLTFGVAAIYTGCAGRVRSDA